MIRMVNFGLYRVVKPKPENIVETRTSLWRVHDDSVHPSGKSSEISANMVGKLLIYIGQEYINRIPCLTNQSIGAVYYCPPCVLSFVSKEYDLRKIYEYAYNKTLDFVPLDLAENLRNPPKEFLAGLPGKVFWSRKSFPIMADLYGMDIKTIICAMLGKNRLLCSHCGNRESYEIIVKNPTTLFRNSTVYFSCSACGHRLKMVINSSALTGPERCVQRNIFSTERIATTVTATQAHEDEEGQDYEDEGEDLD
jgi:hypothetical protein